MAPTASIGHEPAWTVTPCQPKKESAIGPNPTDRGRPGTKRHLLTDRRGTHLWQFDHVPSVQGRKGRPRRRPRKLYADKAYDHRHCRRSCRRRNTQPRIARRRLEDSQRLGCHRWVVERTFSWLSGDSDPGSAIVGHTSKKAPLRSQFYYGSGQY